MCNSSLISLICHPVTPLQTLGSNDSGTGYWRFYASSSILFTAYIKATGLCTHTPRVAQRATSTSADPFVTRKYLQSRSPVNMPEKFDPVTDIPDLGGKVIVITGGMYSSDHERTPIATTGFWKFA